MSVLKKLKKDTEKAKVAVDTKVDTDVTTSSSRASDTGQVGRIVNKKNGTVIVDNSKHIHVDFSGSSELEKDARMREMFAEFRRGEARMVCAGAQSEINSYQEYAKESSDVGLVEFFDGKISDTDLQILKTGLYIQDLVRRGLFEEEKRVKSNAVRANSRAANIINLTTSGYMNDYMRPVFEANDLMVAQAHYDEVVTYLPEIIFVRNEMTESEVMSQIDAKIARRAQYHVVVVKRIIVTGIGSGCVGVIEKVKAVVEQKYQYPDYGTEYITSSGTMPQAKLQIILNNKL